jgi:hypothetical protein
LSFALSSLGRSFVDHCSSNEVGSITREENSRAELAVLAAWKLYVLTHSFDFPRVHEILQCTEFVASYPRPLGLRG